MRLPNLRIAERDWKNIRKHCSPSFRGAQNTEYGVIGLLARRSAGSEDTDYLVAKILWPEAGEVIARPESMLKFTSQYLRRAHLEARRLGLAGLITIHTHPKADTEVGFSSFDLSEDPKLIENLQELWPGTLLCTLVLGKNSQRGHLWMSPSERAPLGSLICVGDHLSYLSLAGSPPPTPAKPEEIFDRARALTGDGALARLSKMTIIVVGASGTGSLICELLARAGCRRIILVDDDKVKRVNLNRILYATKGDAKRKRYKAEVLAARINRLGLGCKVIPVIGSILDETVLAQISDGDLVYGCVDKDYPRMLLCQYAYRHLIPYIDVGAEIGGDDHGIVSTDARVSYVAPGRPCLRCTGLVTTRRLRFESLTYQSREHEIALGYSDDLLLHQPAVMDLNMRATSLGVMLLRHLLQPFLLEPFPITLAENLVTYTLRPIQEVRIADEECDLCQMNETMGFGDCAPPLGLARDVAISLRGPND